MSAKPVRDATSANMARSEAPVPLLSMLVATLLLAGALTHAREETKPLTQSQHANDEPLVMRLSQNAGSENLSNKHSGETTYPSSNCQAPNPKSSGYSLTCTAQCPVCPTCLPAQSCPSPCPTIPKCPEAQKCPTPCTACPACPTCKKPIPPGYEHFPGFGYYRLHTVPVVWMTAKETCEREGAHLAILNSEEEAGLVRKMFNRDPDVGRWLYLGFHDLYKEGKYVTLFGEPLSKTGYSTWSTGQPDNHHNNENCGSMHPGGGLNDLDCSAKQPFICELTT